MSSNETIARPSVRTVPQPYDSSLLYCGESLDSHYDAWKIATESTLSKCSPEQKLILDQIKSPEAARAALLTVESQRRSRRSSMVMNKVQRVLDAVKIFEKAMKIYSNVGVIDLCLLWGTVTFVIQMASTAASCFNKFLDIMIFLCENLQRTEGYEKLFRNHERMQKAVTLLYCDFMDSCILSISFFRQKGISMFWRVLWPRFERKLTSLDIRMRSHQALVDVEATAATIASTRAEELDAKEYRRMWRFRDTITWLDPTDVLVDYERLKIQRLEGLGDWLFDEACVNNWQRGEYDILWINGIPGCGKTMLMSAFLDRLIEPAIDYNPETCTVFFFCDATSAARNCSVALLRSLAAQLLAQNPELADMVFEMVLKSGQPRATSTIYLLRILRSLLAANKKVKSITMLIDALDECSDMEESRVLNELIDLVGNTELKIRLLLSSRVEPYLRDLLRNYEKLSVTPEKTYTDIQTYIHITLRNSNLATLQQGRLLSHITEKLASKSNGQFLWVRLILHELRKVTLVREIEDILDDLPAGLQKAYLRAFQRLTTEPRRRQEVAQTLFRWLACSERYLSLKELEYALALREGDLTLEAGARVIDLPLLLDEVCGSLVEVVGTEKTIVRFVHVTIKEFLVAPLQIWETDNQALLQFHVDPQASHAYIASTCITQLSFPEIQQISVREERNRIQMECQLLSYASMFWATHLSKSGQPKHELLRQVLEFLESKNMEAYLEWYSQQKTTAQCITLLQSHLTTWVSKLSAHDPRVKSTISRFRKHFENTTRNKVEIFGLNSPEHLESVHQLATLLHSSGAWEEAEASAHQCVKGRQRLFGSNHPLTMDSAFQHGSLLRRLGRFVEAEVLHTAVLEGRRQVLGMYHPDTLETEDELATTIIASKAFQQVCKAEQMSRGTLQQKRRLYGRNHERTAATENILASILKDKGLLLRESDQEVLAVESMKECEELCLSCLEVRIATYSEDHPEVSTICNMLGIVTQLLGRLEESEEWHHRTLMARQKVFGSDNPHTQRSMRNLVNTYAKQFEMEKSQRMKQRLSDSLRKNPVLLRRDSWSDYKLCIKQDE